MDSDRPNFSISPKGKIRRSNQLFYFHSVIEGVGVTMIARRYECEDIEWNLGGQKVLFPNCLPSYFFHNYSIIFLSNTVVSLQYCNPWPVLIPGPPTGSSGLRQDLNANLPGFSDYISSCRSRSYQPSCHFFFTTTTLISCNSNAQLTHQIIFRTALRVIGMTLPQNCPV
jgi:hypothetical protein